MNYYSMTPWSKSDRCQNDSHFDPDSQFDSLHGMVMSQLMYLKLETLQPQWF